MSLKANSWVGKKVVIVDDSATVCRELSGQFERLGLEVVATAANGCEALPLIEELGPDLVTLDLIMPQMDGVETFRKIHERWPALPCLVISCLGREDQVVDSLQSLIPAPRFMGKPARLDDLQARLVEVFGSIDGLAAIPRTPQSGEGAGDDDATPGTAGTRAS